MIHTNKGGVNHGVHVARPDHGDARTAVAFGKVCVKGMSPFLPALAARATRRS